ncbi:MAG: DUF6569 family protein [Thermodesulfobacteriota bacterium]
MSRKIKLNLAEILKGKIAGRAQVAGIMEVIPLIPQDAAHHSPVFAVPTRHMFLAGNPSYGTVVVRNADSDRPLIVPTNAAWVTKHRAQDHAVAKAGLVGAGGTASYDNAACVQASQPGAIPPDLHQFQILPASLRRMDKDLAEQKDFRKFWPNITALNAEFGLGTAGGHLEKLFTGFAKELLQFVAEFESLPGQVGALIIINGKLVGVEIAPSAEYWESVWEPLIRYSYGPEALLAARKLGPDGVKSSAAARPRLPETAPRSIEGIEEALRTLRRQEQQRTQEIVTKELDTSLIFEVDQDLTAVDPRTGQTSYTLASCYEGFVGQVVVEEDYVLYASLVSSTRPPKRSIRDAFRFLTGM